MHLRRAGSIALLVALLLALTHCGKKRETAPEAACTPAWSHLSVLSVPDVEGAEWESEAGQLVPRGMGAIAQGPVRGDFEVEISAEALRGAGLARQPASVRLLARGAGGGGAVASADVTVTEGMSMLGANLRKLATGSVPATLRLHRKGHTVTASATDGDETVTDAIEILDDALYVAVQTLWAASKTTRFGPFVVKSGEGLCSDRFQAPLVLREGEIKLPTQPLPSGL